MGDGGQSATGDPGELTEVTDYFINQAFSPAWVDGVRKVRRQYERWAQANGFASWPATAETALLWMATIEPTLQHSTLSLYADQLGAAHRMSGMGDPTRGQLRQYLKGVARRKGRRGELVKVAPLEVSDLLEVLEGPPVSTRPGGALIELRGALALVLSQRCGLPLLRVARIGLDDVRLDETCAEVAIDGVPYRFSRDATDPLCVVAMISDYLALLPADPIHLFDVGLTTGARPTASVRPFTTSARRGQLAAQLTGAAKRSGLIEAAARWDAREAPTLSDLELARLVAHMNPGLMTQLRDRAYTLVGFTLADRHAELSRFDVTDVSETGSGFSLYLAWEKGADLDGYGKEQIIDHLDRCGPLCAACALGLWLSEVDACWGWSGALFPAMRCGARPTGRLDVDHGAECVRRVLGDRVGDRRIATRSMRAGMASALNADGVPLEAVREVTGHLSYSGLAHYLRLLDPHTAQYHLPV